MKNKFLLILFLIPSITFSQSIIYSQPDSQDTLLNNLEVIGKVNNNFLVYKYGNNSLVYKYNDTKDLLLVYSNDMQLLNRQILSFLPSKIVDINFIPYSQFCLVIFQMIENNVMYCKAAKMDETGKLIGEVKTIDSTKNNIFNGGATYIISYSENKKYILFNRALLGLKENKLQIDQITIDEDLKIKKNDNYFIPFFSGKQFISPASIDNTGNIIFVTWTKAQNKKSDLTVYKSPSDGSDLIIKNISINQNELQHPVIKINNEENIYYVLSLYKDLKKGNTQGLMSIILKSDLLDKTSPQITALSDSVKILADKTVPPKNSFNSYRLNDFVLKKDGGFVIIAALNKRYTRIASNYYDNYNGNYNNSNISSYGKDYSYYNYNVDIYTRSIPVNQYLNQNYYNAPLYEGPYVFNSPQLAPLTTSLGYDGSTKLSPIYPKANVVTFSVSKHNQLFATNILNQSLPDAALGFYATMVLDKQVIFIYNNIDKKHHATLNNFSIRTDGSTMLNPVFKNYDQDYNFYPEGGKQVDSKTMIMPCTKNNELVMAKITFDQ